MHGATERDGRAGSETATRRITPTAHT